MKSILFIIFSLLLCFALPAYKDYSRQNMLAHQKFVDKSRPKNIKISIKQNIMVDNKFLLLATLMLLSTNLFSMESPQKDNSTYSLTPTSKNTCLQKKDESFAHEFMVNLQQHLPVLEHQNFLPPHENNYSLSDVEQKFFNDWNQEIDVEQTIDFKDYLVPNETHPCDIKELLDQAKEGTLISVGTERSFIDAALCKNCTTLVTIDVNPRVKAYNDFNTLLLRIAYDREDYLRLRMAPEADEVFDINQKNYINQTPAVSFSYEKTLTKIKQRLKKSNMDLSLKEYYLKNLSSFAAIFFNTQANASMKYFVSIKEAKKPTTEHFYNAKYLHDDVLFNKVQKMAQQGKIISKIGDIRDLSFLEGKTSVSVVDISNIPDYFKPEFKRYSFLNDALIIFTKFTYPKAKYALYSEN